MRRELLPAESQSGHHELELQRFRAAMDAMPEAIYVGDRASMRLVDVNRAACEMTGKSRDALLRMRPEEVLGMSHQRLERVYDSVIAGGAATESVELLPPRPDGSRPSVEIRRRAYRSDGGWLVVSVVSDISERKRAEQVLALEHAVARCLAEGDEAPATLRELIRTICETERWDCGAWFRIDAPNGAPHRAEVWAVSGAAAELDTGGAHGLALAPEAELISRAWRSAEPAWAAGTGDGARNAGALAPGDSGGIGIMHPAFAFPVAADGKVLGVLSFSGSTMRTADPRLLQATDVIGSQIGQFLRRKQKEQELRESEARYRALAEMSADWYWEHDEHQRLTKVSNNVSVNSEIDGQALLGKTRWELDIRYDAAERAVLEADIEARRPFRDFNFTRFTASRAERHLQISGEPMYDAVGRYGGYRGIGRDITERIQAERAIKTNSMQRGLIAKFGQQALAITNLNVLLANAVAAVISGLGADCCQILRFGPDGHSMVLETGSGWHDGWVGHEFSEAGPGTQIGYVCERREPVIVDDFTSESRFAPSEIFAVHGIKSGLEVIIGGAGAPYGMLGGYSRGPCAISPESVNFLQSIANALGTAVERRHAEERLAYLAQYDSLTGLANRELFRDRLGENLTEAERTGSMVGVLYIDLDGFKSINDTHGHDGGDRLLRLVAERLRSCIRHGDTVGRLGGDEFAIAIANLANDDDADLVAEQVVAQLAQPFELDGRETLITASIGISVYPIDGTDADLLLKNADTAMYQGKEQGRNNFQSYSPELDDAAAASRQLELALRHAIEHEEFELHYQPQVSLDTGRVIGAEAMLRWWHPVHGMLPASEFIDVAEQTGLIIPIGQWVLETACKQTAKWQRAGLPDLFVAVNVSPVEIRRGKVVEHVQRALERSGLASRHLEIELTDGVVLDDAEAFAETLIELKRLGICIAIDNFGTGYSSLGSLKSFPINKVKIDQTFTGDIVTNPDDSAIVQAVIAMSHHLQLQVVAKGVETEAQAGFLRRCRCDIAQGFLFGAPMQSGHLKELLDESNGYLLPVRPLRAGPEPQIRLVR